MKGIILPSVMFNFENEFLIETYNMKIEAIGLFKDNAVRITYENLSEALGLNIESIKNI